MNATNSPPSKPYEPLALLVAVGFLLAVIINLSKAGIELHVGALELAFWMNAGAGVLLLAFAFMMKQPPKLTGRSLALIAILGIISFAYPNAMSFAVAEHIGPAYGSLVYALSPLFTFTMALVIGLETPRALRMIGLTLGLIGTATAVLGRLGASTEGELFWIILALTIPAAAAIGNILRTVFWPIGMSGLSLAPMMLLAAALSLAPQFFFEPSVILHSGAANPEVLLVSGAMALCSAIFFAMFFRLQYLAGPVYLSQLGYVGTCFGMAIAAIVFGDIVSPMMIGGVCLVIVGVILVGRAK